MLCSFSRRAWRAFMVELSSLDESKTDRPYTPLKGPIFVRGTTTEVALLTVCVSIWAILGAFEAPLSVSWGKIASGNSGIGLHTTSIPFSRSKLKFVWHEASTPHKSHSVVACISSKITFPPLLFILVSIFTSACGLTVLVCVEAALLIASVDVVIGCRSGESLLDFSAWIRLLSITISGEILGSLLEGLPTIMSFTMLFFALRIISLVSCAGSFKKARWFVGATLAGEVVSANFWDWGSRESWLRLVVGIWSSGRISVVAKDFVSSTFVTGLFIEEYPSVFFDEDELTLIILAELRVNSDRLEWISILVCMSKFSPSLWL